MATEQDRRISNAKGPFNSYINSSTAHLENASSGTRRGEELGLTIPELDGWIQHRNDWTPVYAKYIDLNQRTTAITGDVNNRMKGFKTYAEPLLNKISVSAALTIGDRTVLHLPERDKNPTRRGKIETAPLVGIKGLDGGFMKFRVRTDSDATRASMHKLSDLIEVKYMIVSKNPNTDPGPAPTDGSDGFPSVGKAPFSAVSKKALFILELDPELIGKFIVAFVRWANTSNPANNGPWTLPVVGLIG